MTMHRRRSQLLLPLLCALAGCGDRHPDSGYGANTPVPSMRTCEALCARMADCFVQICNEDTSSNDYDGAEDVLTYSCSSGCNDADVQSHFSDADWACIFMDSCREFVDYDACDLDVTYTCDDSSPSFVRPRMASDAAQEVEPR